MRVLLLTLIVVFHFLLPGCLSLTGVLSENEPSGSHNEVEPCNGMSELCHRRYSEVTFPETHNAFATHEDGILYPASNHETGLTAQWNAGIRAFMVDAHYLSPASQTEDDVRFCHGDADNNPCSYGRVNAIDWLSTLRSHMDGHGRDVVTLLFESSVSPEHIEHILKESGLYDSMYVHPLNTPWATLLDMIEGGTRLVVFWEEGTASSFPWLHDFLVHSWTTNFGEQNRDDMSCEVYRGDGSQPVWHMNHWLSNEAGLSDPTRAQSTNEKEYMLNRAVECWGFQGNRPTFIAVDWWEKGDVVWVASQLNGMDG